MTATATRRRFGSRALVLGALCIGVVTGSAFASGLAASLSFASGGLTPYRTCTLTATPTTTAVVIDTEVRQANPTTNYGTLTSFLVTSSGTANRRAYLRFDITACVPAIPSDATIRLATLRLFTTALPAECRTHDIFRVTATWTETGITWNSQPFGTSLNNPAQGSRTDAYDIGTPVGCANRTANAYIVGATVTADVAAFVAGTATNHGWMIRDDVEGSATARSATFSSKQLGNILQTPQLVITYVHVP